MMYVQPINYASAACALVVINRFHNRLPIEIWIVKKSVPYIYLWKFKWYPFFTVDIPHLR